MKSLSMTREEYITLHAELINEAEDADSCKDLPRARRLRQRAMHLCDRMRTEARMLEAELCLARPPVVDYRPSESEKAAAETYPGSEPGSWAKTVALPAFGAKVVQQIHDEVMIEVPTNADVDNAQKALKAAAETYANDNHPERPRIRARPRTPEEQGAIVKAARLREIAGIRAATVDPERTYREGYATALAEVVRNPKLAKHLTKLTDDQVKHWYGAAPLSAGEYKKMKASRAASDREIPGTAAGVPGYQTEGKTAWRPGEHLFMGADGRVRPIRVCMDPAAKPMDSGTMPLGFADDGAPVYLDRATGLISTGLLSTRPENIQNHRIRGGHSHVATASAAAQAYLRPWPSLNPEQVGEVLREAKRKAAEATPEDPEAARMTRLWGASR